MGTPTRTHLLQWWIDTGTGETASYKQMKNVKDLTPNKDIQTVERSYKDAEEIVEYASSVKRSIALTVDRDPDDDVAAYLETKEHDLNVSTTVLRVKKYKAATLPATGFVAEKYDATLNVGAIDGDALEFLGVSATISLRNRVEGTFDPTTGEFTAAGSGSGSASGSASA